MTHAIRMQGDATGAHVGFDPVGLRIRPGQTVRWTNGDAGNSHTATAYHPANFGRPRRIPAAATPWDSDYLLPDDGFDVTLTAEGVYDYYCVPHEHAGMVGRIIVGNPDADAWMQDPGAGGDLPEVALNGLSAGGGDHGKGDRAAGLTADDPREDRCTWLPACPLDHAALDDAALVELARAPRRGGGADPGRAATTGGSSGWRASVLRDDAEAEDVVQATYVRAFTRLDGFRGEAALGTWLTRIALNEALGRLRQRRPRADLAALDAAAAEGGSVIVFPMSPAPAGPESEAGRAQVRQVLERAVDALPEPFRLVFVMREIEGLSTEEAATLLGHPPRDGQDPPAPGAPAAAPLDRADAVGGLRRDLPVRRRALRPHGGSGRRVPSAAAVRQLNWDRPVRPERAEGVDGPRRAN